MQPSQMRLIKNNDRNWDKNYNQNCVNKTTYDIGKIKYKNCNTKSYYLNNDSESPKT